MARTVMKALDEAAQRHGVVPALMNRERGAWHGISWREYRDTVRRVARALMALGLEAGKGVAILGANRPEWFLADLGAIHAGGVPAGIYTTCSAQQCRYIIDHAEAQVVVVQDAAQLAKVLEVREELAELRAVVLMEGAAPAGVEGVLAWEELLARAEGTPEDALEARIAAQKPTDLCTLIYTSGTTGPPKAVMISHDNFVFTADTLFEHIPAFEPGDGFVSYLPLSHVAEQLLSLHLPMTMGATVYCLQDLEQLGDTLREVRPAMFLGVPRVWEKIQDRIMEAGAAASPLRRRIARWAKGVGLRAGYADQNGEPAPLGRGLAQRLVFSKVRARLGLDRCHMAVTSTAPIARSTLEFYLSLGIPLCEVYGMSECTGPATICTPRRYRTAKAGYALPGTELRIAEDGEICIRGRHVFLGYYKNPEATAETLDADGWLRSGDIGQLDDEGFLQVTDRKKELIITAGGKNISPQAVEAAIKAIPAVAQAVVVGDRRKYLGALLTLVPERVADLAREAGVQGVTTPAQAAGSSALVEHLMNMVTEACADLSRVETVKRIAVLPAELTVEQGELTPTMKLKRRVIAERYAEQIEGLYAAPAAPSNAQAAG